MYSRFLAVVAAIFMFAGWPLAGVAWAGDEDETPQLDASLETRSYTNAATRAVLGQFAYVVGEVDRFPGNATPEQVKKNNLRKRLLDLRLMMDFNAFAYKSGSIDRFRNLVDLAYEAVGEYKDLYDQQQIDGQPIDPAERDHRLNAMNDAVAPFRQADTREKFQKAVDDYEKQPTGLGFDERPRLWQIAELEPSDDLDAAGNAARLGRAVLLDLRAEGLLVDDIFNPQQEERFHDVRKALRSVLVLSDMFPSLSAGVAEAREPLVDLVDASGKANDQVIAYHTARDDGRSLDERAAALSAAFAKSQKLAGEFGEGGALDAFADALAGVQAAHQR